MKSNHHRSVMCGAMACRPKSQVFKKVMEAVHAVMPLRIGWGSLLNTPVKYTIREYTSRNMVKYVDESVMSLKLVQNPKGSFGELYCSPTMSISDIVMDNTAGIVLHGSNIRAKEKARMPDDWLLQKLIDTYIGDSGSKEDMKLDNPNLSLLFVGHDVYNPWTEMAIDHFEELPYPKYHLSHNLPVKNEGVLNMLAPWCLEKGGEGNFDYLGKDLFLDRMIECLSLVPTEYVWYILPDHMYTRLPSFAQIQNEYLGCMDYWGLHQLKVHPLASYGNHGGESEIIHNRYGVKIRYSGGSDYPLSHHATIYRKSWLLDSLKEVKRAGGWSNQDHELYYWVGRGREQGVDKMKRTNGDDKPFRIAEVVDSAIELYTTISLGKLNSQGVAYLKTECTHPNKALYESLKEGDEVFSREL